METGTWGRVQVSTELPSTLCPSGERSAVGTNGNDYISDCLSRISVSC